MASLNLIDAFQTQVAPKPTAAKPVSVRRDSTGITFSSMGKSYVTETILNSFNWVLNRIASKVVALPKASVGLSSSLTVTNPNGTVSFGYLFDGNTTANDAARKIADVKQSELEAGGATKVNRQSPEFTILKNAELKVFTAEEKAVPEVGSVVVFGKTRYEVQATELATYFRETAEGELFGLHPAKGFMVINVGESMVMGVVENGETIEEGATYLNGAGVVVDFEQLVDNAIAIVKSAPLRGITVRNRKPKTTEEAVVVGS